MLTIRESGGAALLTLQSVCDGSKRTRTLMGDDCVTLKFALPTPMHIPVGAYADIEGERFEATEPQQPKQNANTGGWEYDIQLDAQYVKWKNKIFKFIPESGNAEASWSLTAALSVHMGVFLRNLDALGYKFGSAPYTVSIDSTVSAEAKQLTYESCSLLDALYKMAEAYDCEAWVDESVIHFGKCQYNDIVDFEQGVNVETMAAEGNRAEYATRIYAFGSQKNLPDSYRPASSEIVVNGVAQRRLMLPEDTPCIDSKPGLATAEAVEAVLVFDDVYPRTSAQIAEVAEKEYDEQDEDGNPTGEKWTAYRFKLPSFQFSESYMLPDTDLQIIFQTGSLSGMAFNVKFNPIPMSSGQDGYQLWEIIRNEDYGRPLPDAVLKPANGDRVVVVGWDSSQMPALGLIEAAEQELKQKAIAKMEELKTDPANYRCKMISAAMFDAVGEWQPYSLGSRVRLINPGCFEDGSRESRIIGYEYDLARPFNSPVYVVGEKASASRIGDLESTVEALTLAGQTYAGGNGSSVYVIRTNDSTPPSDTNVYSALRTKRERLSRVLPDTALGKIDFASGLESLGDAAFRASASVAKALTVGDYLAGSSGAALGMGPNGSVGEMDYLKVRKKAQFETLEIAEVKAVGGKLVVSPGDGVEITAVEEVAGGWRCSFKASEQQEDGGEMRAGNKFRAGDQILCKLSNVSEGGGFCNRYWWRLCTGAGDGWFELSAADCDYLSDAPEKGDKCAQLGNREDPERQSAIVLSTSEPAASPLMALYGGIDSYSLEGKDMASMGAGFDGPFFAVYGRAYIGRRDGGSYVKYDPSGDLEIKASISAESTVGGSDLGEALGMLADIYADGIVTPSEKRQLRLALVEIQKEYAAIKAMADERGLDASALKLAYMNLLAYLTGETDEPLCLKAEDGTPIACEDGKAVLLGCVLHNPEAFVLTEDGGQLLLESGQPVITDESGASIVFTGLLARMDISESADPAKTSRLFAEYYAARDALNTSDEICGAYAKTGIDGGVVTTGSILLMGAEEVVRAGIAGNEEGGDSDIRIWAGETFEGRAAAPFRVDQAGRMWATQAIVGGNVSASSLSLQSQALAAADYTAVGADGAGAVLSYPLTIVDLSLLSAEAQRAELILPPLAEAGRTRSMEVLVVQSAEGDGRGFSVELGFNGASCDGQPPMRSFVMERGRLWEKSSRKAFAGSQPDGMSVLGSYRCAAYSAAAGDGAIETCWDVTRLADGSDYASSHVSPISPIRPSGSGADYSVYALGDETNGSNYLREFTTNTN